MNATLELLNSHRSVRTYTPDPIPEEHILRAVEAGQAASTSSAVQAYCVIRVRDEGERRSLAELAGPQEKVAVAPEFFVICGDTRRHRLMTRRAGLEYSGNLEAFLLAVIDASLFAQNLCVAFESMGYGICYIGGLRNDLARVDEVLEIPEGVYPLYGLCVGVPAEEPSHRPRLPASSVLFDDRYPDDQAMLEEIDRYDEGYSAYRVARGASPGTWSGIMGSKFASPQRGDLGPYYRGKGADLS